MRTRHAHHVAYRHAVNEINQDEDEEEVRASVGKEACPQAKPCWDGLRLTEVNLINYALLSPVYQEEKEPQQYFLKGLKCSDQTHPHKSLQE